MTSNIFVGGPQCIWHHKIGPHVHIVSTNPKLMAFFKVIIFLCLDYVTIRVYL